MQAISRDKLKPKRATLIIQNTSSVKIITVSYTCILQYSMLSIVLLLTGHFCTDKAFFQKKGLIGIKKTPLHKKELNHNKTL